MFTTKQFYLLLADLLLISHFAFVTFVVVGFMVIWLGYFLKWSFVRNFTFRLVHLLAMGIVALQAVVGTICPLTIWEEQLRMMAGEGERYEGTFIQHWLHKILYYDFSLTVFAIIYCLFFLLIVLTLWVVTPHWPEKLLRSRTHRRDAETQRGS